MKVQKVHTSSYKIGKSWGCNIQLGDYSQYCITHLKVARIVDCKSFHHKKKYFCKYVGDGC